MPENPYFADAGAPIIEQKDSDEQEQDGSYGHIENEHVASLKKRDEGKEKQIHSEKLRAENADKIYE